jgi:hypothetical protein
VFDEHKVNEVSYRRKLKAYQKANPKFRYDSPFANLKGNFNTSNSN